MDLYSEITIPIYGGTFEIVFTNDIWDYYMRNDIEDNRELVQQYAGVVHCYPDGRIRAIFSDYQTIGALTHEAFHITVQIMKKVGCSLSDASEEAYAYLLTWVTDTLAETLLALKVKRDDLYKVLQIEPSAN